MIMLLLLLLLQVLNSQSNIQGDLDALEAAQEACLAAARGYAKQQQQQQLNNSRPQPSAAAATVGAGMEVLRHQLDKAYLAACKANEWREMTEVLVQQRLPDIQLSSLLALSDKINSVLDSWQQAATTEVFWLLGVNTAGLADGSTLKQVRESPPTITVLYCKLCCATRAHG
jgi:type II secretory pathway pseudopilin PulG